MKILLTGEIGAGKTTVAHKALQILDLSAGGFRTERCRVDGKVSAFKIINLANGREDLIGTIVGGRLIPHPEGFEGVGFEALSQALGRDLIVMDELGFLELEAPRFREAVFAALRGPKPVLGVLKPIHNDFLDEIRALEGVELVEVHEGNRDRLSEEIVQRLRSA